MESLLFLHSEGSHAANGRNARKRARADRVNRRRRPGAVYGSQSTFTVLQEPAKKITGEEQSFVRQDITSISTQKAWRQCSQAVLQVSRAPQPHICLDDLLGHASSQIRRVVVRFLRVHSVCETKLLRCRQWAGGGFARGAQHPTSELHSAVVCLEHYVSRGLPGAGPDVAGLVKYSNAMRALQQALRDPDRRVHSSTLAAAHVIALSSMLMIGEQCDWEKHISGVSQIAKLQISKAEHCQRLYIRAKAAPIFMECLLARNSEQMEQRTWSVAKLAASNDGYFPADVVQEFAESVTSLDAWCRA